MSVSDSQPRIVTPQEAQAALRGGWVDEQRPYALALTYTVATEPERVRIAVVKALRDAARALSSGSNVQVSLNQWQCLGIVAGLADAIENGADYA